MRRDGLRSVPGSHVSSDGGLENDLCLKMECDIKEDQSATEPLSLALISPNPASLGSSRRYWFQSCRQKG